MTYKIGACRNLDHEEHVIAERLCASLIGMAAQEGKLEIAYGAALALACFTRPDTVMDLQEIDAADGETVQAIFEIGMEEAGDIMESLARAESDRLQKALDQALAAGLQQNDLDGQMHVSTNSTRNQIIDRLEQLLLEKITA
jgi:hypothetical protein